MDLQKSKLKLECNVLTYGWKLALGQQALKFFQVPFSDNESNFWRW